MGLFRRFCPPPYFQHQFWFFSNTTSVVGGFEALRLLYFCSGTWDLKAPRPIQHDHPARNHQPFDAELSASERDISPPPYLTLPLDGISYSAVAVTTDCVWLGKHEQIEVRESRSGIIFTRSTTTAAEYAVCATKWERRCLLCLGERIPSPSSVVL